MSLGSSLVLYLMIGAGVAVATYLRRDSDDAPHRFQVASSLLFWPLYLPLLLNPSGGIRPDAEMKAPEEPDSEIDVAIARVEEELDCALQTLDGWAEDAIAVEASRLDELKAVWRMQADRIGELNQLLESTDTSETGLLGEASSPTLPRQSTAGGRIRQSEQGRKANINRLRELRDRMQADLTGSLAWVRELVTMIHLARYTGAPASRAEELVAQIAAAVEGLSEVSDWSQETVRAS